MTETLTILDAYGFKHAGGGDDHDMFIHPEWPLFILLYNEGNWELYNKDSKEPRCRGDNASSLNGRLAKAAKGGPPASLASLWRRHGVREQL